jgi:hypothetical protein
MNPAADSASPVLAALADTSSDTAEGDTASAGLMVSSTVAAALTPVVTAAQGVREGPAMVSEVGNVYRDSSDDGLRWYVPGFTPTADDPDPLFSFTATPSSGTATLTLDLEKAVPEDVQAAQQADPALRFKEIPLSETTATLALRGRAEDGSEQDVEVPAQVFPSGTGMQVTVGGLSGPNVVLAYRELKSGGVAAIEVDLTYSVWDTALVDASGKPVDVDPFGGRENAQTPEEAAQNRYVPVWNAISRRKTVELGDKFADPMIYNDLYTLVGDGGTQVIADADMLASFDVPDSEYREITELGDVASAYPSLRALYLGTGSGTVIAVPAAYGMVRTLNGCAAECDAVVDTQPTAASGCRFQLSFTLGPVVDPGDLARLTQDLLAAPGLQDHRPMKLALPSNLDARTASTFPSPLVSSVSWGVGVVPNTFLLNLAITDDAQPAIVKTNLILSQLAPRGTAPLLGRICLRLDDVYQPPVLADAILDLNTTSGSGELATAMVSPGNWTVRNCTALALRTTRCTTHTPAGLSTAPYDTTLAPGQTAPLTVPADADQVLIDCALALPTPVTTKVISGYLAVKAESVQQVHHALAVNATGLQFATLGITAMDIAITLNDAPALSVPTLTLDSEHTVDNTAVDIPVVFMVTGLAATLTITVTGGDPAKVAAHTTVTHDFIKQPIFVLTQDVIAPAKQA